MKTKLKHFLRVPLNDKESTGKITEYMVWSPIHHFWIYPSKDWAELNKREQRFLLKQEVVKIGLRNDSPNRIALFLKDHGKEKNKKLHKRFN